MAAGGVTLRSAAALAGCSTPINSGFRRKLLARSDSVTIIKPAYLTSHGPVLLARNSQFSIFSPDLNIDYEARDFTMMTWAIRRSAVRWVTGVSLGTGVGWLVRAG